jgi:hypothetical protein
MALDQDYVVDDEELFTCAPSCRSLSPAFDHLDLLTSLEDGDVGRSM